MVEKISKRRAARWAAAPERTALSGFRARPHAEHARSLTLVSTRDETITGPMSVESRRRRDQPQGARLGLERRPSSTP